MDELGMISIFYAAVVFLDLIPRFKTDRKAFWISVVLLGFTYFAWMLHSFNIELPSPAQPIGNLVDSLFHVKK